MNAPASHPIIHSPAFSLRRRLGRIGLAAFVVLVPGGPGVRAQLSGGSYVLVGQVTGGGGRSGSAPWGLAGSVATPVCAVSSGGSYVLNGGLVGAYVVPNPDVVLEIERTGDGLARLRWTAEAQAAGYRLEFAPTPGPGDVWQPVLPAPATPELIVQFNQPARYYRLQRPTP